MSFREYDQDALDVIVRLEKEIRDLKRRMNGVPSSKWRAQEVDGELKYLYVPDGTIGPCIGRTSDAPNP